MSSSERLMEDIALVARVRRRRTARDGSERSVEEANLETMDDRIHDDVIGAQRVTEDDNDKSPSAAQHSNQAVVHEQMQHPRDEPRRRLVSLLGWIARQPVVIFLVCGSMTRIVFQDWWSQSEQAQMFWRILLEAAVSLSFIWLIFSLRLRG